MHPSAQFFSKFNFRPAMAGFIGVEREQFVTDLQGTIVPRSPDYIRRIGGLNGEISGKKFDFGYELSACQIESKVGPCRTGELHATLCECDDVLSGIDRELGLRRNNLEVAPENMPLDVFPDPTGRYQTITERMPREVLSAACRVAATHIHIGMPDIESAIAAYNRAIPHTRDLVTMGDGSKGQRMALYPVMAKRFWPEPITSKEAFHAQAQEFGFEEDPRSCWTLIRISIHGTLEFRMFGATKSIDKIVEWASICHGLCT